MKEIRQTYSLRFTRKEWGRITERAKALFGFNKHRQPQRAKYRAYLSLNEAFIDAGKKELE